MPYSPAVPSVPEASIELDCPAAAAWERLADIEQVPSWVPGVAEATVLERDGRARVVQFVTMPSTGSLVYRLRYGYDEAERTLRWSPEDGQDRRLDGVARIVDLGGGRCRLDYRQESWAGRAVPRWAQAALADDTAARTVEAFRRWIESR